MCYIVNWLAFLPADGRYHHLLLSSEIWLLISGFDGSIWGNLPFIKPLRKQQNGGKIACYSGQPEQ
jgi:hypothetical protein